MISDLWAYFVAVLWTWYALLATGIFTILSLISSKWPRAPKVAIWVALGMFVLASFQAWRTERLRYAELQLHTSDAQALTLDQEQRLRTVLSQGKGFSVVLAHLSSDPRGQEFGRRLQSSFSASGWSVGSGGGSSAGSGRSLRILAEDPNARAVSLIMTAFNEANLRYRVFRVCQGTPVAIEIGESESEKTKPE